jgi:predicted tellurium resistance membrane protein TerC
MLRIILTLFGVLVFVGAKMTAIDFVKVAPVVSLAVIGLILGTSIAASLIVSRREAARAGSDDR